GGVEEPHFSSGAGSAARAGQPLAVGAEGHAIDVADVVPDDQRLARRVLGGDLRQGGAGRRPDAGVRVRHALSQGGGGRPGGRGGGAEAAQRLGGQAARRRVGVAEQLDVLGGVVGANGEREKGAQQGRGPAGERHRSALGGSRSARADDTSRVLVPSTTRGGK